MAVYGERFNKLYQCSIRGSDRIVSGFILHWRSLIGISGPVFGIIAPMRMKNYLWMTFLATFLMMLLACSDDVQKPAPVGEYAVLEQLAAAFRTIGAQYPVQLQAMRPDARKEFLTKVFAQAGFGYSATLLALTDAELSITNQDHRDFVDLLLLPGKGLADADLTSIYSADELFVVRRLRKQFR